MAAVSYRAGVSHGGFRSCYSRKSYTPKHRILSLCPGITTESLQKVLAQRTNAIDKEHFVHISLTTPPFESRVFGVISDKNFASSIHNIKKQNKMPVLSESIKR